MFSPFQLGCFIPLCLLSLIITPNTTLFCDPMLGTLPPQGPEARAVARLCPPIPAFLRALRYPRTESDIKLDRRREPITGCTWSWEQPNRLWACGSHPASSKPERDMALGFWEAEPAVPAAEGVWLGVVAAGWVGDLPVLLTGDTTSKTYFWPLPNAFPFSF